jgi:drug/metabolite transporter (DMT)-like permease
VFGSIIAFGAYLTLLKRVGGGPAAFVAVTTPVIALALSTLFEGYRWTWVAALGVVMAVAGNWLALRPGREDAHKQTSNSKRY